MISPGCIVLYKTVIAIVSAIKDGKLELLDEAGGSHRVREKDINVIFEGKAKALPVVVPEGDFSTAHEMLFSDAAADKRISLEWSEFSELVFGKADAESAVSCAREALKNDLFAIEAGKPSARSVREISDAQERARARSQESDMRQRFLKSFAESIKTGKGDPFLQDPSCSRYLNELFSFANGSIPSSSLAEALGAGSGMEAAQKILIKAGLKDPWQNPWPTRAGCAANPPRFEFPTAPIEDLDIPRIFPTGFESFAIDHPWSKDPDDAIAYDGNNVWIHIADPAAYIGVDTPIDLEALDRGSTLYLPEKTIPMLPPGAVEILGLGLAQESPALSLRVGLSSEGTIEDIAIVPTMVRVTRLTYEEADEALLHGHDALKRLELVASLRHQKRLANDAVDIDFPEVSIKADEKDVRFIPIPSSRSSFIVREMMLLAGEAAARWALSKDLPFPYSSQEAPQLAEGLSRSDVSAPLLSEHFARRRGMRASIVGTECLAHRGLGLSYYAQVTSPLRRYQDLLAHYQLRTLLAMESGRTRRAPLDSDEVSRRCMRSSSGSQATRQAERDSRLHWTAFFLAENPDWNGQGIVLETRERDATIFITQFGLEVRVRSTPGLRENDAVMLRLARVDVPTLEFSFEIV